MAAEMQNNAEDFQQLALWTESQQVALTNSVIATVDAPFRSFPVASAFSFGSAVILPSVGVARAALQHEVSTCVKACPMP